VQECPSNNQQRLYDDLAWLWPIISPPEDYVKETKWFCKVIRQHSRRRVRTLLNLGCGGGHHDHTLKGCFEVTGVDTSEAMLQLARRLNPECNYCRGDMRTLRLGMTFEAVTVFDSVNYMLAVEDLQATFVTAFTHLAPGGVLLTLAEQTRERFRQNRTYCSTHAAGGAEITFVQNYYDPDSTDTTYEGIFVFLIRRQGHLEIETDRHLGGIFGLETWLDALKIAGFEVMRMDFSTSGPESETYPMLVGIKPLQ